MHVFGCSLHMFGRLYLESSDLMLGQKKRVLIKWARGVVSVRALYIVAHNIIFRMQSRQLRKWIEFTQEVRDELHEQGGMHEDDE